MHILEENKLKEIIVVGDRVLIKPKEFDQKTSSGLFLPPGVQEKEKAQSGYIVKVGPGYPVPGELSEEEKWNPHAEQVKYMPLQAKEGDLAIYLQNSAYEIQYGGEKYVIVPQNAVLLLVREEDLTD